MHLLIPVNENQNHYHGFITLMDKQYEVSIHLPTSRHTETVVKNKSDTSDGIAPSQAAIYMCKELAQLLVNHEAQLQRKLEQAIDIDGFLVDLVDLLETILSQKEQIAPARDQQTGASHRLSSSYWSAVLEEIEAVGWDRVKPLKNDFSTVQVQISDKTGRQHEITVHFPPMFPNTSLQIEPLDLPKVATADHDSTDSIGMPRRPGAAHSGTRLIDELERCEKQLARFEDFWLVMQDIDNHTWVIDPEKPTRRDCSRRCVLANHCSIQMTIDPLSPRSFPDLRLFGPESVIEPIRSTMTLNADLWDLQQLPRVNLEKILGLTQGFPLATSVSKEDMNIECGICYSFHLDGHIPEQHCPQPKCRRPYHRTCLYEWLRSVPTTRQSFHSLFGACPYCGETITTTVPNR